jgi:hypothetical protein
MSRTKDLENRVAGPNLTSLPGGLTTIRELAAAGWTGLRVRCRECDRETYMPFSDLRAKPKDELAFVALHLRCKECGTRVPYLADLTPYA